MSLKKKLFLGSALLASAVAMSACSDDSSTSSSKEDNGGNGGNGGNTPSAEVSQMACSEIMFHGKDSLEWVEFYIASGPAMESMAAASLHLAGAVELNLPDEPLEVGEYVVATNDLATFKATYPNVTGKVYQWNEGERLANNGDVVSVKTRGQGDVDCSFDDDPPWPSLADGKGSSLVYIGGKDGNASLAQNWAASKTVGGNPGSGEDPVYVAPKVRINEVNPTDGFEDWVEFYNAGDADVDISGWELVAKKRGESIKIPSGSIVPAGGYFVLEGEALSEILLLSRGESLYLREMVGGEWTNSETGLEYPASPKSTAGVVELSDGTWAQGALATATKGKANEGGLLSGPLYISEIFYNPPEGQFEFMEIVNTADTAVPLVQKVNVGTQPWEFTGLGRVDGMASASVPAKGILLMLPDTILTYMDLNEYRSQLGLGKDVTILTYSGKISNRGERLVLKKPYYCVEGTAGLVDCNYSWSDAVLYSDDGLWPREADGAGMSLHRKDFNIPGSDPAAWEAAEPTRGVK